MLGLGQVWVRLWLGFALHPHSKQHALVAHNAVPAHSALHALLAHCMHCLHTVH